MKKTVSKRNYVHIYRFWLVVSAAFVLISVSGFFSFSQTSTYTMEIPYVSQLYPVRAVVGCEPTSVLMALRYKGVAEEVGLKDFLSNMPRSETNPAKGFVGSPYQPTEILRNTIYPNALTAYANTYKEGIARDISGSELEYIKKELLSDNPVVIYATMYWKKPYYKLYDIEGEKQWLLRNNHVVVLAGYDETENRFYIADPYNKANVKKPYFYWMSEEKLKPLYDERKWAIAIGEVPREEPIKVTESILFRDQSFEGYRYEDIIYLDAKTVLKNTKDAQLFTDAVQKTAQINYSGKVFHLNFTNNGVYIDDLKVLDLKNEELFIDQVLYMSSENIDSLLNVME